MIRTKTLFAIIFSVLIIFSTTHTTSAQSILSYGQTVTGETSATAPLIAYTFNGTADDSVTIYALGISPGLQPNLTLLSPSSNQVGLSAADLLTPMPNDARISIRLPESGNYTLLVTSANGTPGNYALSLTGTPAASVVNVADSESTSADLTVENPEQVFALKTAPDRPSILTIQANNVAFTAVLRDAEGNIVSVIADVEQFMLQLQANSSYELTVSASDPNSLGAVNINLGQAPTPPESAPTEEAITDPCIVTPSNTAGAFLRGGPGNEFNVVDGLPGGESVTVTGQNGDFFFGEFNGNGVWVDAQFVTTEGDCDNLPLVAADGTTETELTDEPPTATPVTAVPPVTEATDVPETGPTATFTPTVIPTTANNNAPTATFTPSFTPTATTIPPTTAPTATFTPSYTPTTPPPAQVAPEDARFNDPLNIQLDNTTSVLDFVSYPGGDTEDRVRWDIIGMNQNSSMSGGRARLVIAVSCFGEGTENIQFFTGGQTYSCGQTIVDQEVTANSKTGSVTITAVGGEGTYVQWVLTGTATRVN